ncbi:MAG: hypothetical protein ABWY14_21865, partial [Tardiphaga sp.]
QAAPVQAAARDAAGPAIHVESARVACQTLRCKPNRGLTRRKHYYFRQNLCRSQSGWVFCCEFH